LLLVLLVETVLIFVYLFKELALVVIAPPDVAGRQANGNQLLIFFKLSLLLFFHDLLHLAVRKNFLLDVFLVILVGLVLLCQLLVAYQETLPFSQVLHFAELVLLVLLGDHFFGFLTERTTLVQVLLVHSAILRVFSFLGLKHKIALVVFMHAFHFLVLLLV
jgi:hypothetical protein